MKKLKKSQIFLIVTCSVAAILLTMVLMTGLTIDDFGFGTEESGPRTNVNTHDIDPAETEVSALAIKWLDGPVTVGESPDGMIHITERSSHKLKEGKLMDVSVSAGKLSVRWDDQWFRRWVNIGWFGMQDKELEVLVPQDILQNLTELAAENTSDDLSVTGCRAEEMSVSSVSGRLSLTNCSAGTQLDASTVSGKLVLSGTSCDEGMSLHTVSGEMEVEKGFSQELYMETVSGGCLYTGTAEVLNLSTVSGKMGVELNNSPDEANLSSVSGDLRLALPGGSGFTADYSSVSGEFRTDFPVEKDGGKSGKARCGTGGSAITMSTTSGGMEIERKG